MTLMKAWQDFLDSLSTKGGNVFMMFVCLCGLYGVMIHVTHDSKDSALISVVHDMVVGFGGALLGGLSGNSSRQQMADRVDVAKGSIPSLPNTTTVSTDAPLSLSTQGTSAPVSPNPTPKWGQK